MPLRDAAIDARSTHPELFAYRSRTNASLVKLQDIFGLGSRGGLSSLVSPLSLSLRDALALTLQLNRAGFAGGSNS